MIAQNTIATHPNENTEFLTIVSLALSVDRNMDHVLFNSLVFSFGIV